MILEAPGDFEFISAVCSHGFFMLAPNRWDRDHGRLHTVVPVGNREHYSAVIDSPTDGKVRVRVPGARLTKRQGQRVEQSVRRILRMDEDLSAFHQTCRGHSSHASAARGKFGRLIRSATLFEDVVKVICTCNITWVHPIWGGALE